VAGKLIWSSWPRIFDLFDLFSSYFSIPSHRPAVSHLFLDFLTAAEQSWFSPF